MEALHSARRRSPASRINAPRRTLGSCDATSGGWDFPCSACSHADWLRSAISMASIIGQSAHDRGHFRDGFMADGRIVQKAEIPSLTTSCPGVVLMHEPSMSLLPDCGTPHARATVGAFKEVSYDTLDSSITRNGEPGG